nr:ATP-dependent DNA helicase RecG [Rhodomicrobium vannielii]
MEYQQDVQDDPPAGEKSGTRPALLNPLFADVGSLEGVGPRYAALLGKLLDAPGGGGARIIDLLWHLPSGLTDRRAEPSIEETLQGQLATLRVRVKKHFPSPPRNSRAPYRVICEDETGEIELIFFHTERAYIERQLPVGEIRILSGRIERYGQKLQMPHPDYILPEEQRDKLPELEPVYPLSQGVTQKFLYKIFTQSLARLPEMPEWLDRKLIASREWPAFGASLRALHRPGGEAEMELNALARMRLACDELFAGQLALALLRRRFRRTNGRSVVGDGRIAARITAALPFTLTRSQQVALSEIGDDMGAPRRMLRLLQGDVGSGKTVVGLMAMARAVEAGAQAAMMAPTEILARQHLETIAPLAEAAGLRAALLTGREKGKTRARLLEALAGGEIDIAIGTHALFQPDVAFADLALAIIDEQHRFGVHQRFALQAKGKNGGTDILVMTATPIPRTLQMTHYGDMDVSKLTEKPAGRKPILTRAVPIDRLEEVIGGIGRARQEGAQIYWVCPLVETSAKVDLAAAEERAAHLRQYFGDTVGLVHGRTKGAEKDAVMKEFAEGRLRILVATTVIEVGVNVPAATIMVIEHAERFGLAQLHQLRGRVGRGAAQSSCILLYNTPLTETAHARIDILRQTEDGFRIAEEDLRLRGGGEILGTKQSGDPGFRVANLPFDEDLLQAARDQTKYLLARDPDLTSEQGKAARICLYLFERDEAIRLLRAG